MRPELQHDVIRRPRHNYIQINAEKLIKKENLERSNDKKYIKMKERERHLPDSCL